MRVTSTRSCTPLALVRRRLASEDGFTMLIALGVMLVSSLLVAAAYSAVQGDVKLTQRDLDAKRAYYAARAGVNRFLYQLNQTPLAWQSCPTQSKTPIVTGSGEQFAYSPVPAIDGVPCNPSNPIATMIDEDSGTFRMRFIGYSGNPEVSRGVIVSFRKDTPLDYLWFTVYEALDSTISGFSGCNKFYRDGRPSYCNINWITGDDVNGPMYTQDQYRISGSPVFGRNSSDNIESMAPGTSPGDICQGYNCGSAQLVGTPVPGAPSISLPPSNGQLLTDATNYGKVYTGITTIQLSGTTATITENGVSRPSVNLSSFPIIYVKNGSGCTSTYSPFNVSYPTTGTCGTVYVSGSYSTPVTIAAQTDIILKGNLTRSGNSAVLGLVAENFVRVMHGVGSQRGGSSGNCNGAANIGSQSLQDPVFNAAILAIKHSFIVDNYDCGNMLGELTVNGAIAQLFRGTVGTSDYQGPDSGYLKDYNYDDRLEVSQPPYLFNIASSGWHVSRETLCVPDGTASTAC